ncbi:hypothetical protein H6G06_09390 [Anabaena sphaerica FACHB-251]|uniref:Uncharacterized protein n=1 Tax=Anabaena sphaerica FACHB-251 TaxID=2692883 RepID=A0A926WFW5_9NOST|nr:hypothetical protein [Anabaena sphaerica]MBD2293697.1 hypothetical protein [Anabaena sphaerica FACHB-251]
MKELPYIVPSSQPEVEEVFAVHQTTIEFYQEVQTRSEFQTYCDWYYKTAAENRRELEKMRGELNIMGWFFRR